MTRRVAHARAKARYKWCGAHGVATVPRDTDQVLTDFNPLCESLGDNEAQGDTTIERIILDLSVRRLLATDISALGFIVLEQVDDEVTAAPTKSVNPLDQTNPAFTFGSKDNLLVGLLSYPPMIIDGFTGGLAASREGIVQRFEFRGRKRLNRLNSAVNLWMTSNTADDVMSVAFTSRILLRY